MGRVCGLLLLPGLESRWNPQNSGLPRYAGIVSQLLERSKEVQTAGVGLMSQSVGAWPAGGSKGPMVDALGRVFPQVLQLSENNPW